MKTIENKLAIATKLSVAKVQEVEKLTLLLSTINFINNLNDDKESEEKGRIKIPEFGEIVVMKKGDLEFLASKQLLKNLDTITNKSPKAFLEKEVCKVLGVESE